MILDHHIRGRRRLLDDAKKARLCELIDQESYTVEQAAESLDVSLRTVQRERRRDQDFDHEVRLALQQPPDPLKLMEHAARTHWRAAAWLLERTKPEEFARKPVNSTSAELVRAALRYLQEAALEAVPAEFHEALYRRTQGALERAFDRCFPMMGPWGEPKVKKLPFKTPLADVQFARAWAPPTGVVPDRTPAVDPRFDDRQELYVDVAVETDLGPIDVALPPEDYRHMQAAIAAARARGGAGVLSPTTIETTTSDATECNDATEIPLPPPTAAPADELAATRRGALPPEPGADGMLSPKTPETTTSDDATHSFPGAGFTEFVVALTERQLDDECPETWNDTEELDHPDAQDPQVRLRLLSERLHRHRRQERRQERAAEKKAKAAKKRAEAQRRRAG